MRSLGFRTVPVTVIGDTKIAGFRPNDISDALRLGIAVAPREPSETLPILERLISAHLRAIRQMPEDKLDFKVPDRDRPIREFGYHIFRNIQRTMQAINTGVFPMEDQATQDLPGRSFQSLEEIAGFGEEVLRDYRDWAPKQDVEVLKSPPAQGSKLRSGAEQLDLISGHTTQHLRQLYYLLESFGIALDDRLQDSDLPQEYILTLLW